MSGGRTAVSTVPGKSARRRVSAADRSTPGRRRTKKTLHRCIRVQCAQGCTRHDRRFAQRHAVVDDARCQQHAARDAQRADGPPVETLTRCPMARCRARAWSSCRMRSRPRRAARDRRDTARGPGPSPGRSRRARRRDRRFRAWMRAVAPAIAENAADGGILDEAGDRGLGDVVGVRVADRDVPVPALQPWIVGDAGEVGTERQARR